MSRRDRARWEATHARAGAPAPPARFLVEHADLLPPGIVLDLAAGTGRNACFLAGRGHRVVAIDVARAALAAVRADDARVACVQMDLDAPGIRAGSVDGVIVVNFLDRRLFAPLARWLRPGGVLLWDTFLLEQRDIGHPRNPDFLLARGELAGRLSGAFDLLVTREGLVEEPAGRSFRSGVVARRWTGGLSGSSRPRAGRRRTR
jgi:SAM-dependent methyltransferase